MNRFNYIALSACVALSVSSCDDSFDVSSKPMEFWLYLRKDSTHCNPIM